MVRNVISLHRPAQAAQAEIRPATPETLKQWWPLMRLWLASIKRRQGPRAVWTPEHVRQAIEQGRGDLWLAMVGDELVGFTVTQMAMNHFLNVVDGMFVWMAYYKPGDKSGAVKAMDRHIEQVAKDRGCAYIEAMTARKGLGRRLARHGWECVLYVLRKDLYPVE